MNIVFPMAGLGSRFSSQGYDIPKPLIKVLGKTIVEWSIRTLGLEGNFIFCCKTEHVEKFKIDIILKEIIPKCEIVTIDYQTEGTLQTILEAKKFINNSDELIISDSDHYLEWDVSKFHEIQKTDIDGCAMVFPDEQTSDAFSYVKLDHNGFIVKSSEKTPISTIATVGLHYFKKGSDFVKFGETMINENLRTNNEFYVTPIYNLFAKSMKKITTFPVKKMWALGNPEEVNLFVKEFDGKSNQT